jgi:hypothetical protein
MLPPSRISLVRMVLLCCSLASAVAESRPSENARIPPSFRPLIQRSGYIFAGTVLAVEHLAPLPNEMPIVRVTFHVDEAIRGVHQGQMLTIRTWVGTWSSSEPYRRGERVLLFLYRPHADGVLSITLSDPATGGSSSMSNVLTVGAGPSDTIKLPSGGNPATPRWGPGPHSLTGASRLI